MPFTHFAFSDDSGHQDGRYNSLAITTLKKERLDSFDSQLEKLWKSSGINNEFKWRKLRDAKHRFAAEKIINFIFNNQHFIRIDIIIWDLADSRHKNLIGRDDSENLVRMYYHLVSSTLSKRWSIRSSLWKWYPDKQSSVDWDTLRDCINNKKHPCVADLFNKNPDFECVKLEVEPTNSRKYYFIQVSDLFAGMGAYSFGHFDKYKKWQRQNSCQIPLFPEEKQNFSNTEKERFQIIYNFDRTCKKYGLRIGFDSTRGFNSYNPNTFINFWPYRPQHKYDRAPRKIKRTVSL